MNKGLLIYLCFYITQDYFLLINFSSGFFKQTNNINNNCIIALSIVEKIASQIFLLMNKKKI